MGEIYLRVGRHKPNHLYWAAGQQEADDHDEIGVMFTDHFGHLVARAVNFYLNHPVGRAEVSLGQREVARRKARADFARRADALGKTVICQSFDYRVHRRCPGPNVDMNGGLGCLCDCHDNPPPDPNEPEEAIA
jgi:hypothetical protein